MSDCDGSPYPRNLLFFLSGGILPGSGLLARGSVPRGLNTDSKGKNMKDLSLGNAESNHRSGETLTVRVQVANPPPVPYRR